MTLSSEKIIEAGARASAERNGCDFDNMPARARAQYLGASKAALLAVLPMVAEEIGRVARRGASTEAPSHAEREAELRVSDAIRARFSSLIEDLK